MMKKIYGQKLNEMLSSLKIKRFYKNNNATLCCINGYLGAMVHDIIVRRDLVPPCFDVFIVRHEYGKPNKPQRIEYYTLYQSDHKLYGTFLVPRTNDNDNIRREIDSSYGDYKFIEITDYLTNDIKLKNMDDLVPRIQSPRHEFHYRDEYNSYWTEVNLQEEKINA